MLRGTRTWNRQLLAGMLAVWMLLCAIPQPILAAAGDLLAARSAEQNKSAASHEPTEKVEFSLTLTPEDYRTISRPSTEKLACAPGLVTYGDGLFAVAYLADDTNTKEQESSTTIVCRLSLFGPDESAGQTYYDIAKSGQAIGDLTIGQRAPYEPNLLKRNETELLVLFNLHDQTGKYLYYAARFDLTSKTVISYEPLTLDGALWTPEAIADSYNALSANDISSSGPTGSMVFTSQIIWHDGYYYGYCGGVCDGFAGMLVRSTDGVNWTSVLAPKAVPEMKGIIECGYAFVEDALYLCVRDISSGIYHASFSWPSGEVLVSTARLPGLTPSKPVIFSQDGALYLIVNQDTGDDTSVGRRNTALFYQVSPRTGGLTPAKQVFCADGCAYHSVVNVNGINYWCFHTDARRLDPYTQGRSNLAFLPMPPMAEGATVKNTLDFARYTHCYSMGCITTGQNVWQNPAVNYHYQIPLSDFAEFDDVTVTAGAQKAYIAFFTKRMNVPGPVAYAEGWAETLILQPGEIRTLPIPKDAAYLYILNNNANGDSLLPKTVVFGKQDSVYNGKTLSILGDSISTYAGVSNNTSYNSTIGKNSIYYSAGALGGQQHTWWQQTIDALGMRLLVNNSWSGSTVLKPRQGAGSEGYLSRCVNLHNDKTGETPDVIAVFLGTNDFSYYQSSLGTADIAYATLISPQSDGSFVYATPQTTCEAYAIMLHKMQQRYPDAEIFCMTLLPRREPDHDGKDVVPAPTAFNSELAKVIAHFGCTVVDLEHCGITPQPENFDYYISDKRVHPGAAGMDKMSEALISAMLSQTITLQQVTGQYTGTNSDNSAAVALPGAAYTANLTVQSGYESLRVTVTMGGDDITKTAYANGRIHIPSVTGEIVIAAKAVKLATDYRWEFADSSVSSVTMGGNKANALTLLGGSLTDGVLQGAYFRMAEQVTLYHHRPWVVEWSAAGNWSGMLLSKLQSSNAAGNEYFFKSNSVSIGLIAFGQWQNGQYMNYGIRLADHGVDTSARHIYRLENRIAKDGSNAVHLLVDGVDFGVMAHHYIGTTDQSSSANWANGHDLTFDYIGTNGHAMNGCDLDYLQVWEAGDVRELPLRYDDRYDVSGKSVEIINAGSPSSYKVGYGVAAGTLDDAVITLDGDTLIATGIGTAQVKIDGVLYEITVTAAPLSLILIIGQSNAEGMVGNANQSIACKNGQVYSTYAEANGLTGDAGLTVNNASNYVPSALTGAYSTVNVNGTDTKLSKYPVNSLTESGSGKYGIDSGIAYEWVQQTGEKVWIVNAAHGASSISSWQRNESNFEEAAALMDVCQSVLQQEIKAGHFTMSHMGYYWCQGCADEKRTAEWYTEKYIAMHQALKQEMAFDADLNASTADATIEFGGIILVMAGHENATGYRKGTYEDASEQFFATFKELEMRGPRVAQIWLASNPSYPDIHLICTLAQDWVTMPDGSDGVAEYFAAHYQNGKIDYPTQKAQSASWYTPTTPAQVKNSIHYYQVGYNEVGREAARNMLYVLGVVKKPEVEVTVRFVDWTGYQAVDSIKSSLAGSSSTLVVPLVSPCYESKNVTYTLSNNLTHEHYDLLDKTNYGGQLTADIDNVSVSVVGRPLSNYRFELNDNGIMESVTNHFFHGNTLSQPVSGEKFYKLQEPIILMHDKEWRVEFNSVETTRFMALTSSQSTVEGMFYFFKSKSGTGVLSIGQYKDGVYQNYGLKQSEIAVDWTQPHVFCFRNILNEDGSNTIHIYTDDIWVGTATNLIVNDVLQSTNDTYLSERDLVFTHLSCGGFALNADQMTYLEVWEDTHTHIYKATITPPTCTEQGYTTHTCECGDSYVDSYVPATGHKFSVYTADGNATYEADGTKTALCDHGCGAKDTVADVGSMLFPEQVTSSVYTISDGVLSKVPTGTTVSALLSGLDWGKYCTVFDTNGKPVEASAKVATGMVVKLLRDSEVKQTLTIAVRGDTNGDGTVTLTDFVQIKAHLLQKQTLTGAAVKAADYSADGSVTVTDFMQVKALLLQMPA